MTSPTRRGLDGAQVSDERPSREPEGAASANVATGDTMAPNAGPAGASNVDGQERHTNLQEGRGGKDDEEVSKVSKKKPVESVAELLHNWYAITKRRTPRLPTMREFGAMDPDMGDTEKGTLVALAASDRTLEKTRQLLLLVVKIRREHVANRVREFAGAVLQRHPAFHRPLLATLLEGVPAEPEDKRIVDLLMAQDYSALPWPQRTDTLRKRELNRCRANAVCCVLMWLYLSGKLPPSDVVHYLRDNVWKPAAGRRDAVQGERLHALMSTKDSAAASVLCELFEERLRERRDAADAAQAAERAAARRVRELEAELAGSRSALEDFRHANSRLRETLVEEGRLRADDRAHLKDDYQRLRGRVLRRLKEDRSLLEDGLHALRRQPPKVRVMMDHAQRVIDSLGREVDGLVR